MKRVWTALTVAGLMAMGLSLGPGEAKAASNFNLSLYGPGYSFSVGKYPRRSWRPYPYPRAYGYRYRRPAPRAYYRSYRRPVYPRYRTRNSCTYWANQCARNWGYGNNNYQGCLRYHRCN